MFKVQTSTCPARRHPMRAKECHLRSKRLKNLSHRCGWLGGWSALSCTNASPCGTHLYWPFSAARHKRVIAWSEPVTIQMRLTILSDHLSFDLRVTRLIYKLLVTVSSFFPGLMDICLKFDAVFKRNLLSEDTERRRIESTRQA